jgi:hypothetical protein
VGLTRLELVTFPLSEGCSNRLSYRPFSKQLTARQVVTNQFATEPSAISRWSEGTLTTEE